MNVVLFLVAVLFLLLAVVVFALFVRLVVTDRRAYEDARSASGSINQVLWGTAPDVENHALQAHGMAVSLDIDEKGNEIIRFNPQRRLSDSALMHLR